MLKTSCSKFVGLLVVALLVVEQVRGQFPRHCVDSVSLAERECCPMHSDGSKCGEESGRGYCEVINAAETDLTLNETLLFLLDERARWPLAMYDRACACTGNFDGVDCSRCLAGYQGENCQQRAPLVIRRNITSMSVDDLQKYVDTLNRAKVTNSEDYVILTTSFDRILQGETPVFRNVSIYNLFVWMHSHVSRDNLILQNPNVTRLLAANDLSLDAKMSLIDELLSRNVSLDVESAVDYGHEGPAFLPWHRYYLLKWEAEIRELVANDPTFALPYWDWRNTENCDVCNDVMMGGRSPDNRTLISSGSPFSRWEVICTRSSEYIRQGQQCTGEPEGPLIRDHGNYDPLKITGLPTAQDVDNALTLGDEYDTPGFDILANQSYRNLIEGFARMDTGDADPVQSHLHNAVHLYMNGTMSSVDSSANDPIFVIHHAYVDSLFELWLRKRQQQGKLTTFDYTGPDQPRLGHRAQDFMVPFFPLVRNERGFAGTEELGYVYDYISSDDETGSSSDVILDVTVPGTADGDVNEIVNFGDEGANENAKTSIDVNDDIMNVNDDVKARSDVIPAVFVGVSPGVAFKQQAQPVVEDTRRLNAAKRWAKARRGLKLRPYKHGEGGFSLYDDLTNIVVDMGSTQMLLADNRALAVDTSSTQFNPTLWQRIKNSLAYLNRVFREMSYIDLVLIVFLCALAIMLSCMLVNLCCSRGYARKRREPCCSGLLCCCCCGSNSDPSESVALLEPPREVFVKGRLVKGTSYM